MASLKKATLRLENLEDRLTPTTHVWIGEGATTCWSDAGNWHGGAVPASNEPDRTVLLFGKAGVSVNNIAGLEVDEIQFLTNGHTISLWVPLTIEGTWNDDGKSLSTDDIVNYGKDNAITGAALMFEGDSMIIESAANTSLVIESDLIGQALGKTGAGKAELRGTNSLDYTLEVHEGELALNNTSMLDATSVQWVHVGGEGSWASLKLLHHSQLADSANVFVEGDGRLDLDGHNEILDTVYLGDSTGCGTVYTGEGMISVKALVAWTAPSMSEFNGNLSLGAFKEPVVIATYGDLLFIPYSGEITGWMDSGIVKTGPGKLLLAAPCSFDGPVVIEEGILSVQTTLDSPVYVTGGVLMGDGYIGDLYATAGMVVPGALYTHFGPDGLATGNVQLGAVTYEVWVDVYKNTSLEVMGTVSLDGTILSLSPKSNVVFGTEYTIVNNDGKDAVQGTFAGLAEGAVFVLNGMQFQISYVGGDGNDVVLTQVVNADLLEAGTKYFPDAFAGDATMEKGHILPYRPDEQMPRVSVLDELFADLACAMPRQQKSEHDAFVRETGIA